MGRGLVKPGLVELGGEPHGGGSKLLDGRHLDRRRIYGHGPLHSFEAVPAGLGTGR
jgi:hypothetical protein